MLLQYYFGKVTDAVTVVTADNIVNIEYLLEIDADKQCLLEHLLSITTTGVVNLEWLLVVTGNNILNYEYLTGVSVGGVISYETILNLAIDKQTLIEYLRVNDAINKQGILEWLLTVNDESLIPLEWLQDELEFLPVGILIWTLQEGRTLWTLPADKDKTWTSTRDKTWTLE